VAAGQEVGVAAGQEADTAAGQQAGTAAEQQADMAAEQEVDTAAEQKEQKNQKLANGPNTHPLAQPHERQLHTGCCTDMSWTPAQSAPCSAATSWWCAETLEGQWCTEDQPNRSGQ